MSERTMRSIKGIDGKEQLVEEIGQFKNWGVFFDWLMELDAEYHKKYKATPDPYRQYMHDQQRVTIAELQRAYGVFLENIGTTSFVDMDDIARPFIQLLEEKQHAIETKATASVPDTTIRDVDAPPKVDYMGAGYRGQIKIIKKVLNQFLGFKLQP